MKDDLKITNAGHIKELVKTVAGNYGLTISAYLKTKIRIALDAEPERMKRKLNKD
jgi:hypothetical protein